MRFICNNCNYRWREEKKDIMTCSRCYSHDVQTEDNIHTYKCSNCSLCYEKNGRGLPDVCPYCQCEEFAEIKPEEDQGVFSLTEKRVMYLQCRNCDHAFAHVISGTEPICPLCRTEEVKTPGLRVIQKPEMDARIKAQEFDSPVVADFKEEPPWLNRAVKEEEITKQLKKVAKTDFPTPPEERGTSKAHLAQKLEQAFNKGVCVKSFVTCMVCNSEHEVGSDTYLTFYGNVMIGQSGGTVGNNFDNQGVVNRTQFVCRDLICLKDLFKIENGGD